MDVRFPIQCSIRRRDETIHPIITSVWVPSIGSCLQSCCNATDRGVPNVNFMKEAALVVAGACAFSATPLSAQDLDRLVPVETSEVSQSREHGCLTEAIYREAGSEPMHGRMAVAQVIVNRTRSGIFPSTVCGVVYQRGQFNFQKGLGPKKGSAEVRLWLEAKKIASMALQGSLKGAANRALYFKSSAGRAFNGTRLVAVIGRHAFYAPHK